MQPVRSFSDLERAAREASENHQRLLAIRMAEIVSAIEDALQGGAETIDAVLKTLSRRERENLVEFFPVMFSHLTRTNSADEIRAVIAGARALLRASHDAHGSRFHSKPSARLAAFALASVSVAPERRRALAEQLSEIDEASVDTRRLARLWLKLRGRALLRTLRGVFALKPQDPP